MFRLTSPPLVTSSSQLPNSDPFIQAESQTGLRTTGKSNDLYLWSQYHDKEFSEWWEGTYWAQHNSERGNAARGIQWDSRVRSSNVWQNFDQAAKIIDGTPFVVCRLCSTALVHPNVRMSGTSALSKHTKSNTCQRRDGRNSVSSFRQTTLHDQKQQQVRISDYYKYYYNNITTKSGKTLGFNTRLFLRNSSSDDYFFAPPISIS